MIIIWGMRDSNVDDEWKDISKQEVDDDIWKTDLKSN